MTKPDKAIILAAGKGTRLKPHTDTLPKPMVKIAERTLVDHIIDALIKDGIKHVAINLHHFGNKLQNHLKTTRDDIKISFSTEGTLLDTGGGIRKASRLLQSDDPFYVINGDAFWIDDDKKTALTQLADFWDPEKMDILLLLQKTDTMTLTQGIGDYDLRGDGKAIRSTTQSGQYMFTSIRIMTPQSLRGTPEGAFSFLDMMDRAEENGRLYGVPHDGDWHHISTPKDLERVNAAQTKVKK